MVFRVKPFDEPEVISRRLMHIPYGLCGLAGSGKPSLGDGTGSRVITMDITLSEMPDAVWLRRLLPHATVAHRSNNREVQAQLCFHGAGFAVLPRPLGDVTPNMPDADQIRATVLCHLGLAHAPGWLFAREIASGDVRLVLRSYEPSPLSISAVHPAGHRLTTKVRVFIEFLAEIFAQEPSLTVRISRY
jgi:DNA-binding transcriptional LysR family regulator